MILKKFAVNELTSPQVDQIMIWLTTSWFVIELSSELLTPSGHRRLCLNCGCG